MNTDSPINRVEQVQVDDLACWRIHTAHGEALIAQQGAQLLSYQPHEQPPLVWLSDEAGYRRGQSVRGGCRCAGRGSVRWSATRRKSAARWKMA